MLADWIDHLSAAGRQLGRGFLHLLYPGMCSICATSLPPEDGAFCAACRSNLTSDPHPACPRCAATVGPFAAVADGCVRCQKAGFVFESVLRLGFYQGPLREVILRLKYSSGEGLAERVGELWAEHQRTALQMLNSQIIIPMPLHWWRRWQRGYNQSEALAQSLAAALHLPCYPSCLRRIRSTPKQTQQSATMRRTNVQDAFCVGKNDLFMGKSVLLVDDVLTTGSTANEAAKALRRAGAHRVVVAVLARSHPG